ncbi:UDP-N-acetylglucosamine/UDP-glucose/GDP-mannose transporter isoform X1 [Tachysurus ichikawai]
MERRAAAVLLLLCVIIITTTEVNPVTSYGQFVKLFSAAFYAVSSFVIVIVNKTVLTTYRFPSYTFLGIGQMACTIIILYLAKMCKAVSFQDFDKSVYRKLSVSF